MQMSWVSRYGSGTLYKLPCNCFEFLVKEEARTLVPFLYFELDY